MRRHLWILLLYSIAASAALAGPVLFEAEGALRQGQYDAARQILTDPSLQSDPGAWALLAQMTAAGQGGPVDLVEAYALYTRVFMLGAPDPRAEALYQRRQVAKALTPAQILDAEARVVAWVDAREGSTGARKDKAARLAEALSSCDASFAVDGCYELATGVFDLGPAGPETAVPLERLMTRDPHWTNRELYAWLLAELGSAGVPALCRVIRDTEQVRQEGTWNAARATQALGSSGAVARPALPCIAEVLNWRGTDISPEEPALSEALGLGGSDALLLEVKSSAVNAVVLIGDPEKVVLAPLMASWHAATDPTLGLILAWGIGMTYADTAPALDAVTAALSSTDDGRKIMGLAVLRELASQPGFADKALGLKPQIEALSQLESGDGRLAAAARDALQDLWP